MKNVISNKNCDLERSLYNLKNTRVENCTFKGENDGESVLKETHNIEVVKCLFSLRYPLWHAHTFKMLDSKMDEATRAPIWYSNNGEIVNSTIYGVKAVRESKNITITNCLVDSTEFGWRTNDITINDSQINSQYFLFESKNIKINNLKMTGKYSFQYTKNMEITSSYLDTKDAFWHAQDVVVKDSIVKGEYLGWFSKNLTFINCHIEGTQPLCYAENLTLINCTMDKADLAFEYSSVNATINGKVDSIKNPKSGVIEVDEVGEIIKEHPTMKCVGIVKVRKMC